MRKDTWLQLLAIALAIILFVVGYIVRTLPLPFMVTTFTLAGLLLIAAILGLTGNWAKLSKAMKRRMASMDIKLQSPIIRQASAQRQPVTITKEQQDILDFYEKQKENWKYNLRLRITHVELSLDADVPKVIFSLAITNYLPVECKLIKVIHSSGTVSASSYGSCDLPALPESIEERILPCSEKDFTIEVEVKGTRLPDFIKPLLSDKGRRLQWTLKGEWYVEIFGKPELWMTQSSEKRYDQFIEGFYMRTN